MDYRELSRIAADPVAVRSTAALVKALLGPEISDWQQDFLSKLEKFNGPDRLSTRQCETLISLRDRAKRRSKVGSYAAFPLVRRIWELRFDLDAEDEAFVDRLYAIGPQLALFDSEWMHVFGLARQFDLIDAPYIPLH